MFLEVSFITIRSCIKYVELLAALVGTYYFYKYKRDFLKYFLIILWYTAINEFLGFTLTKMGVAVNIIIYNIFHFINFSFLFLLFNKCLKIERHKKFTKLFLAIYVLSFFVNMWFQNYIFQIQTIPYLIASVLLITSIVFYFSEILNTNEVLFIKTNIMFWISVGYLLYLAGNIPIRVIRNYLFELVDLKDILEISSVLSIIMNICFILGFIWGEKDKRY